MVARSAVHNAVGIGLPLVVALAAIPWLARELGSEAFGLLGIAWLLLSYAGELGFGRATTRFVADALGADRPERISEVVWTTAALQGAVAALAGGLLWLASDALASRVLEIPDPLVREARTTFRLMAVGMPAVLLAATFRGVLEASQRFDRVNRVRIPVVSATYALPVVAVGVGWSLPGIVGLLLAARLVGTLGYLGQALRLHPEIRRVRWAGGAGAVRLVRFSGWVMVSSVVSPLLAYLDRFLLGALVGMTAVAFYTAPYELAIRTTLIPAALAGALFPAFGSLSATGRGADGAARSMFRRSVLFLFVAVGAVAAALALGAEWITATWLGGEFGEPTVRALQLLMIGIVANALAYVPHSYLQGIERADVPALFHLIELPLHVALAWWLIARYGVAGAAAAWSIRVTLDAVLLFIAAGRLGMGGWWSPTASDPTFD